jgi:hypothetical protein
MRGASFHLKPVRSPAAAEAHNTRTWSAEHQAPRYILPEAHRLGAWREIAAGDVQDIFHQKMRLASGKARSMREYSPLWEGVLNLDHPTGDAAADRERYAHQVRRFAEGYEAITGHRVIAADIHLDEGRIDPLRGQPLYNAHAHVVVDRTDDRGRPIRLTPAQLRQVQDLAAEATGLERGEDARETRRRHVDHSTYRALARQGAVRSLSDIEREHRTHEALVRLDLQRIVHRNPALAAQLGVDEWGERVDPGAAIAPDPVVVAEAYGHLRGLMKASGIASQADYVEARQRREDDEWVRGQTEAWEARLRAQREAQEAARTVAEAEAVALSARLAEIQASHRAALEVLRAAQRAVDASTAELVAWSSSAAALGQAIGRTITTPASLAALAAQQQPTRTQGRDRGGLSR